MPLFRRIADIVSANLNEMVARFEDPETMLRQAVREMDEAVGVALDRAVSAVAHEKLLTRELAENRRQAERWQVRARKALEAGEEDLARRALAHRIEHERLVATLEDQQATASAASVRLRRQIDGLRAKLAEAKRELAALTARKRIAEARGKLLAGMPSIGAGEACASFDRWRQRIEFAEAEADAWCELTGDVDDNAFEALDNADVEQELAILKDSLGE